MQQHGKTSTLRLLLTLSAALAMFGVGCVGEGEGDSASQTEESGADAFDEREDILVGNMEVLIATSRDGRAETIYNLRTADGRHVPLEFDIDAGTFQPEEYVELAGRWDGNKSTNVSTFTVTGVLKHLGVDHGELAAGGENGDVAAAEAPGKRNPKQHRVAVIMLGDTKYSREQALAQVNPNPGSAASYLNENSGGIDTFEGDVFGPYDVDTSDCRARFREIGDLADNAARRDGANLGQYNKIAYLIGSGCGLGGLGEVSSPGGNATARTWYGDWFDCRVVAHELGHNLGLFHSHHTDCGSNMYNLGRDGCEDSEYGHVFDVMGGGGCGDGHFGIPHKQYMGWLADCEDVTAGGDAIFNLSPMDGDCGMRSLRIPIRGENSYYYLEYRDTEVGAFGGARGNNRVLLTVSNDGSKVRPDIYLLDSTPGSENGGGDFRDGWLQVGKDYALPGDVVVRVLSLGDEARVQVSMPGSSAARCHDGTLAPEAEDGSIGLGCGDGCPEDPNKTRPGYCGCGVPDGDSDGDGVRDCDDQCPSDPNKAEPGICGCGVLELECADLAPGIERSHYTGTWSTLPNFRELTPDEVTITNDISVEDFAGTNNFGVVFEGGLEIEQAGTYEFELGSDDGSSLRIGVREVIDNDGLHGFRTVTGSVELSAGVHPIRVEFFERGGGESLRLRYRRAGGSYQEIPAARLFHATDGTDDCPDDPNKTDPGVCGCGEPETDSDDDGIPDCEDPADTYRLDVEDAFVDSASPTDNFGTRASLEIDGDPSTKVSLLKPVGLDQIPANASVQSATLVMQAFDAGNDVAAHALAGDWSEGSVTFDSAPAQGAAIATFSGSVGELRVDVTALVQSWLGGAPAYGLGLYPTGNNGVDLYSSDASGTAANHPYFEVVVADGCPDDPDKDAPGACGCGVPDTDADSDGTADCNDGCPGDGDKTAAGQCGCGVPDTDADSDGTADCNDGCPADGGKVEPGQCGCGVPEGSCDGDVLPGLRRAHYSGDWSALPDFTTLTPDADEIVTSIDVADFSGTERFGVVFTGLLRIDEAGQYDFEIGSDDGSRLQIDESTVVVNDGLHPYTTRVGSAILSAGLHTIRVEFFEKTGGERLTLRHRIQGQAFTNLPADALFHRTGGGGGSTVCAEADERSAVVLTCPAGSTIARIDFASYGTPTGTCGAFETGTCHAATSLSAVRGACIGRSECTVNANNGTFGDPCAGTPKRLAVQYVCTGGDDGCPDDPNKTEPGQCGCGVPDTDTDGDGTPNCNDGCPEDQLKTEAGVCGCGIADADSDGDGSLDCNESCPADPDKQEPGVCGCGEPDADSDGDGAADCQDECPDDANKIEAGTCGCGVPEGECGEVTITASGENARVGEGMDKAADGDTRTKWLTFTDSAWIQYTYPGAVLFDRYSIASANDVPARDPRDWQLLGSNDGESWEVLDERSDERFTARFQTRTFDTGNTQAFRMYRLDITSNLNPPAANSTQLSEFTLERAGDDGDSCPDDPGKSDPGVCGCGTPDTDSDGDGAADCQDGCPADGNKVEAGECGCGVPEGDCGSTVAGLRRFHYSGEWTRLPNFDALTPDAEDVADTVALGPYAGTERFGLVFTGDLTIDAAGTYDFELGSDDGSRLYIDGELVVDNDGLHGFLTREGSVELAAGAHSIRVEFFERTGGDVVRLRYRQSGGSYAVVPTSMLSHTLGASSDE